MTSLRGFYPFLVICLVLVTGAAYAPGLSGGFEFDDEVNIVRNQQLQITAITPATLKQAAYSLQSGPLMRPVSFLSLAINHYFTGLDPLYFKLTNLFIHLLNGLALWLLTRQLLIAYRQRYQPALTAEHIRWISLAVCAFWLLHPLGLTSVLYVIQRMTSLSALFVLLGLATFAWGRNRQLAGKPGGLILLASVLLFTPLAALSKENGVLLPFFMLITEITLFRFATQNPALRVPLWSFFIVFALLPGLLIAGYLLTHLDWVVGSYSNRDFTLTERLLTQARVIWFYISSTVAPSISQMALFHDDIRLSTGLMSPPTTAVSIAGLAGLLIAVWVCRKAAPIISFGLLFFLVGHSMESSIIALEIAHEHRNYLPMYGILLPVVFYLLHPTLPEKTRKARVMLGIAFIALLAGSTAIRASYWGNPMELALVEARNHPESTRNQYRLGRMYWQLMEQYPDKDGELSALARKHFAQAKSLDPGSSSGLIPLLMLDARQGLPLAADHVDDLVRRLEFRPFASATYVQLSDLGECLAKGLCQATPEQINRIFSASLNNPSLVGSTRAKVLSEAMILSLVQGDLEGALRLGKEAMQTDPQDAQHGLNYANLLIQSGDLVQAESILRELGERGLSPFLESRLNTQRESLREAQQRLNQ